MSWRSTAQFYEQLRMPLQAGIGMQQALAMLRGKTGNPYARWLPDMLANVDRGRPLSDQLAAKGERPLPVALVRAGESSGLLPEMCRRIVETYEHAITIRNQVIFRSLYPLLLLHLALILPPIVLSFEVFGGSSPLWALAGPALLWVGAIAAFLLWQVGATAGLTAWLGTLPVISAVVRSMVAANVALVMHAAVAGGLLFPDACEMAAASCGNRVWGERLRRAGADLRHNRLDTLTEALAQTGLPRDMIDLCRSGEEAGELEQTFARIAALQRERFVERVAWASRIATGLIFALGAGAAIIAIFTIAGTYFGTIRRMAEGI